MDSERQSCCWLFCFCACCVCECFFGVCVRYNTLRKQLNWFVFGVDNTEACNCTINRQISESNHFVCVCARARVFFAIRLNNSSSSHNNEQEEINNPQSGFSLIVILFANLFVYFCLFIWCALIHCMGCKIRCTQKKLLVAEKKRSINHDESGHWTIAAGYLMYLMGKCVHVSVSIIYFACHWLFVSHHHLHCTQFCRFSRTGHFIRHDLCCMHSHSKEKDFSRSLRIQLHSNSLWVLMTFSKANQTDKPNSNIALH